MNKYVKMTEQEQITFCEHCQTKITGSYCPDCGRPQELIKINGKYIVAEIRSVINFERGILFTIKELLIRPGKSIQDFIHIDRKRLVKPIIFIIISSLIYSVIQQFMRFEDGYTDAGGFGESTINSILEWIQGNYGYANILMAIFIAIWIKVFFRKYGYNFFEILVLLCYVMGIVMLLYTVFGVVESLTDLRVLRFGGVIGFIYISWAIGQFFDKHRKLNYFKGLLSYFLGMISFFLVVIFVGMGIDFLQKML